MLQKDAFYKHYIFIFSEHKKDNLVLSFWIYFRIQNFLQNANDKN